MTKLKKIIIRIVSACLILVPICAFAHFLVFPQETRCLLIDLSDFKKDERIYYNSNTPQRRIDSLKAILKTASRRAASFWGEKTCDPKFIYCENEEECEKYMGLPSVPANMRAKLGSYIVISSLGLDVDIIAHELSHAELYERIGFYNWNFNLPHWFNEGLAMQVDFRNYYSEDTLKVRSDGFKKLPDVNLLNTPGQFYTGTDQNIKLNYMTAKHEVKNWYSKEKLEKLIEELNSGKSFEEAFVWQPLRDKNPF